MTQPVKSLPGTPLFQKRGFYLHACWKFNYPFAVRSWSREDFAHMFNFLRSLQIDRVMLWPMTEALPAPLTPEEIKYLEGYQDIITDAQKSGLECWLTSAPNLSSRSEIRQQPFAERHLYPFMQVYRLDDPNQFQNFTSHLEEILAHVNNADGYVFIDGDPGSYPGAKPEHFYMLLEKVREIVQRVGIQPQEQKVIPWIWCGWGTDWAGQGAWRPELEPLVRPVLQMLKDHPLQEPWELLPGRSNREGWANGRINLILTEETGLIDRSTLLTYEIIEYEPTPPAVVLQFDDIRRVIRQEMHYATQVRGIYGNAQQPIMSLPNLFYFSRCTYDPIWLDKSDHDVLVELSHFLGGSPDLLVPAWSCLKFGLDALPEDLPLRLVKATLTSETAAMIPGGPERYLNILADFVNARLAVLKVISHMPDSKQETAEKIGNAVVALAKWWAVHAYVFSGEDETGFSWKYTHAHLLRPLTDWVKANVTHPDRLLPRVTEQLAQTGIVDYRRAEHLCTHLLNNELHQTAPGDPEASY